MFTGADPRELSVEGWLDDLDDLVARLSAATTARIEVGPYWLSVGRGAASAALGARVRAEGPLLGIACDSWEAALCVTGGADGAWADAFAFPFRDGSTVTRAGRLAELGDDHDVDEYWLHFADGGWVDRGWRSPEGAGEWNSVRAPGDACFSVACAATKPRFAPSEPVTLAHDLGTVELHLHRLRRDGAELVSPARVPRPGTGSATRLDALAIPGGWGPGRYQAVVRLDQRSLDDYDSSLSTTVEFVVGA